MRWMQQLFARALLNRCHDFNSMKSPINTLFQWSQTVLIGVAQIEQVLPNLRFRQRLRSGRSGLRSRKGFRDLGSEFSGQRAAPQHPHRSRIFPLVPFFRLWYRPSEYARHIEDHGHAHAQAVQQRVIQQIEAATLRLERGVAHAEAGLILHDLDFAGLAANIRNHTNSLRITDQKTAVGIADVRGRFQRRFPQQHAARHNPW